MNRRSLFSAFTVLPFAGRILASTALPTHVAIDRSTGTDSTGCIARADFVVPIPESVLSTRGTTYDLFGFTRDGVLAHLWATPNEMDFDATPTLLYDVSIRDNDKESPLITASMSAMAGGKTDTAIAGVTLRPGSWLQWRTRQAAVTTRGDGRLHVVAVWYE